VGGCVETGGKLKGTNEPAMGLNEALKPKLYYAYDRYADAYLRRVKPELRVKHSSKHCYHCYFKTGGKQARVYMAISGGTTNIEEDIACLITELFGEKLDPSKAEIRRFLKEKGLRIEDLIKQATKEQLKRCFLGVTEAIEQLEQS
jgi:tRNA A37 threonylcarbamoyltransferase TsaD